MPNGKTHEKASMVMAWGASTVLLGLGTPVPDVAAFAVGLLSTRWLSADLDLSFSSPAERWGPIKIIWKPYQAIVRRHRSRISHSVLFGTLIRLAYFLFLWALSWSIATLIAFILVGKPLFFNWLDELTKWRLFWIWLFGLVIGDIIHIIMDFAWSIFKRPRRRLR
jgi:uncharacterized metal-binding protein